LHLTGLSVEFNEVKVCQAIKSKTKENKVLLLEKK